MTRHNTSNELIYLFIYFAFMLGYTIFHKKLLKYYLNLMYSGHSHTDNPTGQPVLNNPSVRLSSRVILEKLVSYN